MTTSDTSIGDRKLTWLEEQDQTVSEIAARMAGQTQWMTRDDLLPSATDKVFPLPNVTSFKTKDAASILKTLRARNLDLKQQYDGHSEDAKSECAKREFLFSALGKGTDMSAVPVGSDAHTALLALLWGTDQERALLQYSALGRGSYYKKVRGESDEKLRQGAREMSRWMTEWLDRWTHQAESMALTSPTQVRQGSEGTLDADESAGATQGVVVERDQTATASAQGASSMFGGLTSALSSLTSRAMTNAGWLTSLWGVRAGERVAREDVRWLLQAELSLEGKDLVYKMTEAPVARRVDCPRTLKPMEATSVEQ